MTTTTREQWNRDFNEVFDQIEPYLDDDGIALEAPADLRMRYLALQSDGAFMGWIYEGVFA